MPPTRSNRGRSFAAAVIAAMTMLATSCQPYGPVEERCHGARSAQAGPPPLTGYFEPGAYGPGTYTIDSVSGLTTLSPGR